MRKTILALATLLFCSNLLAQAPQLMSYQAVVRNGNNQLLSNAPVGMRISVLQGSANGNAVYSETHSVTTNAQGLATLSIGGGTPQSGSFAGVNWANGPYFLKAETDPSGGSNYTITATSQLLSVPYALHSSTSVVAENGLPTGAVQGQVMTFCDGVPVWTNNGLCPGKITALNCSDNITSGVVTIGTVTSAVSGSIPYLGGNGGAYSSQIVSSTGVTGLTATFPSGTLVSGSGSLSYTISGTPSGNGTANFNLTLGGQSCTFSLNTYPDGTVHCGSTRTAIINVTNPVTGKIWMDRNLGASQVATSSTNFSAYGGYFQWGRKADGHQCNNSLTTSQLSSTDQAAPGIFILSPNTGNWLTQVNNNLWQGALGINNPCPSTYRIPTSAELDFERMSWSISNSVGGFASPLKLTIAGARNYNNGLLSPGSSGYYWSSTADGLNVAWLLYFNSTSATLGPDFKANGYSIRCIKD